MALQNLNINHAELISSVKLRRKTHNAFPRESNSSGREMAFAWQQTEDNPASRRLTYLFV